MENSMQHQVKFVFNLLKITFAVVPVVAGLDKFTNILTDWSQYLHPALLEMLPLSVAAFMIVVGIIEIAAGILVWIRPGMAGYVVAAWLTLIALNLLFSGRYLDVAVRDLVMAISAFAMAKMATLVPKE
ncbi:hypothetical protein EDD80_102421 [Anseongella ginsenosidimutans]|uniref:DoxX-like protein n=1 Tax=Anseongella ginsenosidimutans TaxID=496056 RepID=A0A4R3KUV8_9SPHI|nr:hypothetical protein [Anseongella ginsenosidimutans]QEC51851.1 hypothetical protein FRZ59_05525 [Anseongella ginsenosidimutans]TCS89227.1 hypothetical protein EDD80_102421 [Anseongella ginsenosidimutans]